MSVNQPRESGTAQTCESDSVARTGTLAFAPGATTMMFPNIVKGNSKQEANRTFSLDLFGNRSNALLTQDRGLGMILNDD
jgi:hypothetical protein